MAHEERGVIERVRELSRAYLDLFELEHVPLAVRVNMTEKQEENARRQGITLRAKIQTFEGHMPLWLDQLGHVEPSEDMARALHELDAHRKRGSENVASALPEPMPKSVTSQTVDTAQPIEGPLTFLRQENQETSQLDSRITQTKLESKEVRGNSAEPLKQTVEQATAAQASCGTTLKTKHTKKTDLSTYLDAANLTDRQCECASLRWEYELTVSEIARKLNLHRKTVDQHIHSAQAKMRLSGMYEKMQKKRSRVQPGQ